MFSKRPKHDFTPQDFSQVIRNLSTQRDLVMRQLQEGSISQRLAEEEMQRISSLISAYNKNLETALNDQRPSYSPR